MPLIIKGNVVDKSVVEEEIPSPTPIVQEEKIIQTEQTKIGYHEVRDGELHKLFNKKSHYLRDALDLDNHK